MIVCCLNVSHNLKFHNLTKIALLNFVLYQLLQKMTFFPQDAIFRVDYNGNKRQTIRSNLPSPRGLTVLKGDIFWVDRNLATVFKASKLPNQVAAPETVKSGLEGLRDIAMVDRQNQPLDKNNPCYVLGNGYCDQLCFSYPQVKIRTGH